MDALAVDLLIALGVLLLLVLLAFLKAKLRLLYNKSESLKVSLKILFFKINIYDGKAEKEGAAQKNLQLPNPAGTGGQAESGDAENKYQKAKKISADAVNNVLGSFDIVKAINIIKMFFFDYKRVLKGIYIEDLSIGAEIATGDAAKTAILYGQACSVVYPLVGLLESRAVIKKREINISPDFTGDKSSLNFHITIVIKIWHIIYLLWGIIKQGKKNIFKK